VRQGMGEGRRTGEAGGEGSQAGGQERQERVRQKEGEIDWGDWTCVLRFVGSLSNSERGANQRKRLRAHSAAENREVASGARPRQTPASGEDATAVAEAVGYRADVRLERRETAVPAKQMAESAHQNQCAERVYEPQARQK